MSKGFAVRSVTKVGEGRKLVLGRVLFEAEDYFDCSDWARKASGKMAIIRVADGVAMAVRLNTVAKEGALLWRRRSSTTSRSDPRSQARTGWAVSGKERCERCEVKTASKALEGLRVRDKGASAARAFRACVSCANVLHRFAKPVSSKVRGYRLPVGGSIPF